MHNNNVTENKDKQGMVLVLVLCLMAVLFLLGTAALNNITTEYQTSYNYMQSVQAFNDAEAGIGDAVGIISANLDPDFGTPQDANNDFFQYNYTISFDPNHNIYTIVSQGFDPTRIAMRQITAEYLSILNPAVVSTPLYSETGDFIGVAAQINGDPNCPPCATGYWSDNSPVPAVSTSASSIDFEDYPNQLDTNCPVKIKYNARPGIDFNKALEYYKPRASITSIANGDIIGDADNFKLVYVLSVPPNPNFYEVFGDFEGHGILVLEGNFKFTGGFIWHGLVISDGNMVISGNVASGSRVTGAVLTSGECSVEGNAEITWCPGTIRKALRDFLAPPLELVSWKEN